MAMKGTFRRCLNQMVEMIGREPSLEMIIVFDHEKGNYILDRYGEGMEFLHKLGGPTLRTVVRPTYNELREMLKPRQLDVFKEDKGVDNSKDLQTRE